MYNKFVALCTSISVIASCLFYNNNLLAVDNSLLAGNNYVSSSKNSVSSGNDSLSVAQNYISAGHNSASAVNDSVLAAVNGNYLILKSDIEHKINFINLIYRKNIIYSNTQDRNQILFDAILTYLLNKEASLRGYSIEDSKLKDILTNIERSNNLEPGYVMKNLKKYNLNTKLLFDFIKQEYIATTFRQGIVSSMYKISENEIENGVQDTISKNGKLALDLYEISIPISANNAKLNIQKAYKELQLGVPFDTVGKKYSTTYCKKGTQIGWVLQDILDYEVFSTLQNIGLYNYTKIFTIDNSYKIYMTKQIQPALQINTSNPQQIAQIRQFVTQKIATEKATAASEQYTQGLIQSASIQYYDK